MAQVAARKRGSGPSFLQGSSASLLVTQPCDPPQPHRERAMHSCVGTMTLKLNRPQVEANNQCLDEIPTPLPENAALELCICSFCSVSPTLSLLPCVSLLRGDPELVPLRSSEQGAIKIRKVWVQILLHQPCDLGHIMSFLWMSVFLSVKWVSLLCPHRLVLRTDCISLWTAPGMAPGIQEVPHSCSLYSCPCFS